MIEPSRLWRRKASTNLDRSVIQAATGGMFAAAWPARSAELPWGSSHERDSWPKDPEWPTMWILLNDSFLSVVQDRDDSSRLLVRSRIAGDIERALCGASSAEVFEDPTADYRYRCFILREEFEQAMVQAVRRIDYANFKNSISNPSRKTAAKRIWQVLFDCFGGFGRSGELSDRMQPSG